jgi:hypothetical protein
MPGMPEINRNHRLAQTKRTTHLATRRYIQTIVLRKTHRDLIVIFRPHTKSTYGVILDLLPKFQQDDFRLADLLSEEVLMSDVCCESREKWNDFSIF